MLRLNSNGTTDTTFGGGDGILTYNLGYDDFAMGSDVVYQGGGATGQGWLVIAGGVSTGSFVTALVGLKLGGQTTTATYYSKNWQALEERSITGAGTSATVSGTAKAQNVWSTVYVDALVARDEDITTSTAGLGRKYDGNFSGGLERRLYFQQDANFNVTSLILDTSGSSDSIVERQTMTPYGERTVRNASWTTIGSSAYSNFYGHQGGKIDVATSLVYFRFRDYNAALGRWNVQDAIGWLDSKSRYETVRSRPTGAMDPSGLITWDEFKAGAKAAWNLFKLFAKAQHLNYNAPDWMPGCNECQDQATRLANDLGLTEDWRADTAGGFNGIPKIGYHHVVVLIPRGKNPLPPVVFDPFIGNNYNLDATVHAEGYDDWRDKFPMDCGCSGCRNQPMPPDGPNPFPFP